MATDKEILAHLNRTRKEAIHGETGPNKIPTKFTPFKSLKEAEADYEPQEETEIKKKV